MSKDSLFIRFGLHKDRETLKLTKELYCGIVVPAHILSYSPDATIAAINHIDTDYFIDPMTYVFTAETIRYYLTQVPDKEKKNKSLGFKPSIKKMAINYGILSKFEEKNFTALTEAEAEVLLPELAKNSVDLQMTKVDSGFAAALKKYSEILKLPQKNQAPTFITTPYFFFDDSKSAGWLDVNIKYANATKQIVKALDTELEVIPILLAPSKMFTQSLLSKFSGFRSLIIWPSDIDESSPVAGGGEAKLRTIRKFVELAKQNQIKVLSLYGSYFSICMNKLGVEAVANGIFYGEHKNYKAKVGGGGPVSRYYINRLHKFFTIPVAIRLLQQYPGLLEYEPEATLALIKNDASNIADFDDKPALAQEHFLESRRLEYAYVKNHTLEEIVADIKSAHAEYAPLPTTIIEEDLSYLNVWVNVLDKDNTDSATDV
jgi:hypothetical protein